ncbi:serine O-acetyltransferase EpsC [Foetidibacter luteolus]|uniref:serine O-acetyltransferase EpsC n=1 Tax=Foetidibacter luteolus TaxID=2608880 RepID=UPI00129A42B0|nr:serine O-acetyltransferase EpsC [Foetidibacter luteolus]
MKYPGFILSDNLPSSKEIHQFTESLICYLFPVTDEPELFLQHHEVTLYKLQKNLIDLIESVDKKQLLEKEIIADEFCNSLEEVKDMLLTDARLILEFDPAATSLEEIILSYPGFYAIMVHRLAHLLYQVKVPLVPRIMSEWAHSKTGIDINPGASIGCPFFIDHGTGVVIGETTVIGNNVKIYQGVTLGALAVRKEDAQSKRHPTIEDDVIIYAGSTILGGNTVIGRESIIGGNTWITKSVPPFSIVYHKNQTVVNDRRDLEEPINFVI